MSLRQELWVCGRCPFAHLPRPLALGLATRPPVDEGAPAGATELPTSYIDSVPAPGPPPHRPETHASMVNLGPPPLPFRDGTNSRVYVPLLLDAAGLLSAFRPMRSARGGHMPPSASGGLPQSRPCLPAPLYPCARFAQQWNMFPKPFHRRRSSPAHLSASGHGPRLESHRSRHSQRSSAPSPRRMKATTSRPLCRKP